jgi:hypothetical protein
MKPRTASSIFAAACVAAASAAHALPPSDRTTFELFVGGNVATPGSFRGPVNVDGPNGATNFTRLDFDDAYEHDYTAGMEVDYNVDSHVSAFARAGYSQFNGQNREIGALNSTTTGRTPIEARFEDADTAELDVGARYSFSPMSEKWQPFVGAALGATHMPNSFAMVGNTRVSLGKSDTVFQQRLETGLQYSPMPNFGLRLTAAALHMDGSNGSSDPALALLGLDSANAGIHEHWSYPAELGAVWHF